MNNSMLRVSSLAIVAMVVAVMAVTDAPVRAVASPIIASLDDGGQQVEAQRDVSVRRSRLVALDTRTLPTPSADPRALSQRQPALTFELFPDVFVVAQFTRSESIAGYTTWVGRVEGEPTSHVTLVYGNGMLTGNISSPRGSFRIRPVSDALRAQLTVPAGAAHEIAELNHDVLPKEAEPVEVVLDPAQLAAAEPAPATDNPVIDVMVLYTPLARVWAGTRGGIEQLIALGVSETNASYVASGVNQTVRLVHMAEVAYTEPNDFGTALSELRANAGALANVGGLRNTYGADLVALLVQPSVPSACGIAYVQSTVSTAFAPNGYSVTGASCVTQFTMAHEWGHNMGAQHDWYVSSSRLPFTYAHGYANPAPTHRWRTIMAYNDLCSVQGFSCRRLLAWANPTIKTNPYCATAGANCNTRLWFLPGDPMGVPAGTKSDCTTGSLTNWQCDADDRQALNNTGATVAAFRATVAAATPTATSTTSRRQ